MKDNKTYSVYCHTCPNGMQYFGMSGNIKNRWKPSCYKDTSLKQYIDKFGWKSIKHEILYSNLTRDEALKLEDSLIVEARNNGTCINMFRSGHYQQTDEYKAAEKVRWKAYNEAHPEKRKAIDKAYREAHPEECKARNKAYYETHQEEEKARKKAYYEAHPEECKARAKAYREAHPEEHKAKQKAWREAHPNYMREWHKRKKAEKQAQQSDTDKVKATKPKPKRKKPLF